MNRRRDCKYSYIVYYNFTAENVLCCQLTNRDLEGDEAYKCDCYKRKWWKFWIKNEKEKTQMPNM